MIVDPSADDRLDRAFMALADPVRRRIIARLSRGPATVNELAEPFEITKQAVSKHIQVLEQAGLVTRTRDAQRRPVHLNAAQLEALTAWIDKYRLIHEQQFRQPGRAARDHRRRRRTRRPGTTDQEEDDHDQRSHHHRAGRRAVHRVRARVRRPGRRGLPRPQGAGADQAVARAPTATRWTSRATTSPPAAGYRYLHRDDKGEEYAFNGVFHVVRENEFAIQTFEFEGFPDVVAIESLRFDDLGNGRTRLERHSVYPTVEARDGMVASDMETGMGEGYAAAREGRRRL